MNSMTGYGKGIAEANGRKLTVEMKGVNHRFLDILFKMPRGFAFAEDTLRKLISSKIERGHLDVFCNYEDNRESASVLKLNECLAKEYLAMGRTLESLGCENDLTASQLMKIPDVVTVTGAEDDEDEIKKLIIQAATECLNNMLVMRKAEGSRLVADIKQKVDSVATLCAEIEVRAPIVGDDYKEKLRARISEALAEVALDEARLLNEVAFFVDKANIDEEITRLKGHISHVNDILTETKPIGKRMDFLVQEMNREINTIGSKSNDMYITERVLRLKTEVEKIREQIQNLE